MFAALQEHRRVRRVWMMVFTLLLAAVILAQMMPYLSAGAAWIFQDEPVRVVDTGKNGIFFETETEPVAYQTVFENDYTLAKGEQVVKQEGKNGIRTITYEADYVDDELTFRNFLGETVEPATDEIIRVGVLTRTAPSSARVESVITEEDGSGYLILNTGESLHFSRTMAVTCTAYTAGEPGVDHITATGTTVHRGVVAVDRKVIPLGTDLFIVSNGYTYGQCHVEDTGVRGAHIDLYMDTLSECNQFGRRSSTAYFLD